MVLVPIEKIDYWQDLDAALPELKDTAKEARKWIVKMIHEAGSPEYSFVFIDGHANIMSLETGEGTSDLSRLDFTNSH